MATKHKAQNPRKIATDELLLEVVSRMHMLLLQVSAEAAHLKTIGLWDQYHGIANLISNETGPELSMASECKTKSVETPWVPR